MKRLAILGLVLATGLSQAAEIYRNGPVVDAGHLSVIAPGAGTYGFGVNTAAELAVADDFTVAAGQKWAISSLDFFSYQTGAAGFTLQNATWSIRSGDANEGLLIATGVTALSNVGLEGYRVMASALTNTQRPIYRAKADISDISLTSGHYWLSWSLSGSGVSGPWVPPTADGAEGNAAQRLSGGAFTTLIESGLGRGVELPFAINGTVTAVPEADTYAMLLAGLLMVGAVAHRRKAS